MIAPPKPPVTETLNATVPPKHKVVGVGALNAVHDGSALTVTVVLAHVVILHAPFFEV